jgi:hypothetical protein
MRRALFLIAVRAEIKRIKRLATAEEIDRLDFSKFSHSSAGNCIYGQMTGYCGSDRATEIMPKSFSEISLEFDVTTEYKQLSFKKGDDFTYMEKYLYICSPNTHKHIIDFLKGKVKVLSIK